jgi:haloacetate dehalogenase
MAWFEGFERQTLTVAALPVCFRRSADWSAQAHLPVLVLLHGFPQTHVMWHRVAQQLRGRYRIVMPDLRGYGDSSHLVVDTLHQLYSKRAMAQEVIDLLDALGVPNFYLCGHDRGGRVAHRLALDHASRVRKLCVIDIAPTLDMYSGHWGKSPQVTGPVPDPYFAFAQCPKPLALHWPNGWSSAVPCLRSRPRRSAA